MGKSWSVRCKLKWRMGLPGRLLKEKHLKSHPWNETWPVANVSETLLRSFTRTGTELNTFWIPFPWKPKLMTQWLLHLYFGVVLHSKRWQKCHSLIKFRAIWIVYGILCSPWEDSNYATPSRTPPTTCGGTHFPYSFQESSKEEYQGAEHLPKTILRY
jgi:hypothetical protein